MGGQFLPIPLAVQGPQTSGTSARWTTGDITLDRCTSTIVITVASTVTTRALAVESNLQINPVCDGGPIELCCQLPLQHTSSGVAGWNINGSVFDLTGGGAQSLANEVMLINHQLAATESTARTETKPLTVYLIPPAGTRTYAVKLWVSGSAVNPTLNPTDRFPAMLWARRA